MASRCVSGSEELLGLAVCGRNCPRSQERDILGMTKMPFQVALGQLTIHRVMSGIPWNNVVWDRDSGHQVGPFWSPHSPKIRAAVLYQVPQP